MRPLEKRNPGQGRTGAAWVNRQIDCFYFNRFSAKFQTKSRLLILQSMIPADGYFEPELSLAIDQATVAKKESQGGLEHVGAIVARVMAELARRHVNRGGQ